MESEDEVAEGVIERPVGYEFEPELNGSPPREIPSAFFEMPYHQRRMNAYRALFTAAVFCEVMTLVPFVDQAGMFLLPLQYLFWIGLAFLAAAVAVFAKNRMSLGNLEYIRSAEKHVGRVLDLAIAPAQIVNGVVSEWNYWASVAVWKDDVPEIRDFAVKVPSIKKAGLRMTYRVGDAVTAVEVPGDRRRPLRQLYGFLQVRPDVGLVRKNDRAMTLAEVIGAVGGVFALVALLAMIILGHRYGPIDATRQSFGYGLVGALVLGVPACAIMVWRRRLNEAKKQAEVERALANGEATEESVAVGRGGFAVLLLGMLALSGGVFAVGAMTVNAVFDDSKPEWRPVDLKGMYQKTHVLMVREYYLEYTIKPSGLWQKYHCAPWHLAKIAAPRGPAFAAVHKGALGMEWVGTIEPEIPIEK